MKKGSGLFTKRMLGWLIVMCIAIVLFILLSNFKSVAAAVGVFFDILSPFIIAIAIAYLLDMPVRFFERRVFKKLEHGRIVSIVLVYVIALALVVLLIGLVVPQLASSITGLVNSIPNYLISFDSFVDWLTTTLHLAPGSLDSLASSYSDIVTQITDWIKNALPSLLSWGVQIGSGIVTGVINAMTALIASIYMLVSKKKLLRQVRSLFYAILAKRLADWIYKVADLSNRVFSGFVSGKVVDCVIVGVVNYIFMFIVNQFIMPMPYGLLISVIIGVTNFIPFFGPFIGTIPSLMILLMANPWSALVFLIFTLIFQQVEGNIIAPKILSDTVGLPALWVLVAIIVGGGLFGFGGMIWGVPVAAVIYTLASDFVANRLHRKNLDAFGKDLEQDEGLEPEPVPVPEEPAQKDE